MLANIDFSPENVVATAAAQARLFLEAADYRMDCYRKRQMAETRLERQRVQEAQELRQKAKEIGEKTTEANVAEMVSYNPEIRQLQDTLFMAEESEEASKLLLEAYRMRRDCLRVVAELVSSELAMGKVVAAEREKMTNVKRRLAEKYED